MRNDSPSEQRRILQIHFRGLKNCITFSDGQRPMLNAEGQGGSATVPAIKRNWVGSEN
jgi:hypothetical protein